MPALALTHTKSFHLFMYQILSCRMRKYFLCIVKNLEDILVMSVMFPVYRETDKHVVHYNLIFIPHFTPLFYLSP